MSFRDGAGAVGLRRRSPLLRKNVMSRGNRGYVGCMGFTGSLR